MRESREPRILPYFLGVRTVRLERWKSSIREITGSISLGLGRDALRVWD